MLGLLFIIVGMLIPGAVGIISVHNALSHNGYHKLATTVVSLMVVVLMGLVAGLTIPMQ